MKKINESRPVVQIESRPQRMKGEKGISEVLKPEKNSVDSWQPENSLKASAHRYSQGLFPTQIGPVLPKGVTQPPKPQSGQRNQIEYTQLGKLTPKSANMKRVKKSAGGFMVAFPLKDTKGGCERLQNEEKCLLQLRDSKLPVVQVYTTRTLQPDKALSEVGGRQALITDWVEGYEADIWKSEGQLRTAIKKFFHEVSQEHRQQRGEALFKSLSAILNFFQSGNCIVDLQVVIESATGTPKIIDPANVYKKEIPKTHQQRHQKVLKDLTQSLTLVKSLLEGKETESAPVEQWNQEKLVFFWENQCDFDDTEFMVAIWESLSTDAQQSAKFVEVMKKAEIVYPENFEKFATEKGAKSL